ncbi:MAG: FtsX-like permease family protein [Xanthomonadales bacterium]|jgi:putative ABC transport system permease protein|nr:FtsX-like permease family protein [Xanthomonadales bacterium]
MILRSLLSHYRRHPLQGLFLLTGVVIANVLLVGTLLINAQARASYNKGEQLLTSQAVGRIEHRLDGRSLDERDYVRLRRQGFDMVVPVLRRVVRSGAGEPLELLGIDPFAMTGIVSAGTSSAGELFTGFPFPPYQLWVAPARLQQLGWHAGERITLDSGVELPPVVAAPGQQLGHRLLLDMGALQAATGNPGELSYLGVFAAPPDRLAALRDALPGHLRYTGSEDTPDPGELTQSFHLNLAAMGLLAFVVGIFLTYNAIAFSYTDRHELIRRLRLAGVTRRELKTGLLQELALFLVAGSLVGYWLGAQLAAWLLPGVGRTLAQLYGVYISYPDALVPSGSWLPLAMTAIAAGLCVLFPLREALDTPLLERWKSSWQIQAVVLRDRRMLLAGLVLLAAAALLGAWAQTLWLALAGMACLLLGAALMLPTVLRVLLAGLASLFPPRRARLNWLLADSRWLLGPASLALMAMTLALVANSGLNTMISSFRQATDSWLNQRLAADLYVVSSVPAKDIQDWLGEAYPGLTAADRFRTRILPETPGGRDATVEVVSLQNGPRFRDSIDLIASGAEARSAFISGAGLYISERAWRLDGWQPGDTVFLCPERPAVPVLGVYHDYGNPLSQWMVEESLFHACWPRLQAVSQAIAGPASTPWGTVRLQLAERFALKQESVIDQVELKNIGLAVFDRTFTVTQALNALTLLVAGIGIFCAVSAIHHHRVGHQALLTSLGLSRRERAALLLSQWGLLGLLCMVLVWPFGTLLAAYLAGIVTPVAFGWSFPLQPDWPHYGLLAIAASVALVLAVLLPSLRLLRASPATLLREQTS